MLLQWWVGGWFCQKALLSLFHLFLTKAFLVQCWGTAELLMLVLRRGAQKKLLTLSNRKVNWLQGSIKALELNTLLPFTNEHSSIRSCSYHSGGGTVFRLILKFLVGFEVSKWARWMFCCCDCCFARKRQTESCLLASLTVGGLSTLVLICCWKDCSVWWLVKFCVF